MNKVYIEQTALRLYFSCSADITGYTTTLINVLKPLGTITSWTATVDTASTGSLHYDIPTTTVLNIVGKYKLQPYIIFSNGTSAKAETTEITVYDVFG
jgi:hypothetical protein